MFYYTLMTGPLWFCFTQVTEVNYLLVCKKNPAEAGLLYYFQRSGLFQLGQFLFNNSV
jgi:hypothetical protein